MDPLCWLNNWLSLGCQGGQASPWKVGRTSVGTEYLSLPRSGAWPFRQDDTALGAALGLQSKDTSLPTCARISVFIGVLEKSGADAGKEGKKGGLKEGDRVSGPQLPHVFHQI